MLQKQLQKKGSNDWHFIVLGFMVRTEISCPQLQLLLLCENCVDEDLNESWLRGHVGTETEGGDQFHEEGSTVPSNGTKLLGF